MGPCGLSLLIRLHNPVAGVTTSVAWYEALIGTLSSRAKLQSDKTDFMARSDPTMLRMCTLLIHSARMVLGYEHRFAAHIEQLPGWRSLP